MATFAIVRDTLSPTLRRLTRRLGSPADRARFTMRWGTRIRKIAIENAIAKGGRKFWRAVARSINLERKGDEVTVGAHHVAAAQKQYGGSIKAKGKAAGGANALTIPIADEAEGQTAAKFMAAGKKLLPSPKHLEAIAEFLAILKAGSSNLFLRCAAKQRIYLPTRFFRSPTK